MNNRQSHYKHARHALWSVLSLAVFLAISPVHAATTYTSSTPVGGNWSSAASWTPVGGPPTALNGDTAIIRAGDTVTVDNNTDGCDTLNIGDGNIGTATLVFSLNSVLTVSHDVTIGGGSSSGSINMSPSPCTLICGRLLDTSVAAFTPGGGTIDVMHASTLPSNALFLNYNNLTIDNTISLGNATVVNGALNVNAAGVLQNTGQNLTTNGAFNVSGTFSIQSAAANCAVKGGLFLTGTGIFDNTMNNINVTFSGGGLSVGASAQFNAGTGQYTFDTIDQSISGPGVTFATLAVNSINLTNSGNVTFTTQLTGSGKLIQGPGSVLSDQAPAPISTAVDFTAVNNTVAYNFGSPIPVVATSYYNLSLLGPAMSGGNFMVAGTFQIGAAGSFSAGSSTYSFAGDFNVNAGGAFTAGTSIVNFTGAATQNVSGNLTLNSANFSGAGSKQFGGTLTIGAASSIASGTNVFAVTGTTTINGPFNNAGSLGVNNLAGTGTFTQLAGAGLIVNGTLSGITPVFTGAGNSVVYSGSSFQTILATTYQNLTVSMGSTKSAGGALTIGGNVIIGPSTTLDLGNGLNHTLAGNLTAFGTLTGGSYVLTLNGSLPQHLDGPATFNNLVLNNAAGAVLDTDMNVILSLTFTAGKIVTGGFVLHIGPGTPIVNAGAASYINGNVAALLHPGDTTFTYPVGDAAVFAPVTVNNLNVANPGELVASTTGAAEANFATSGLNPQASVTRFWTLSTLNGFSGTFDPTFNFVAGDVTGGNPAAFTVREFTGGAWITPTQGTPTATSGTVSGVNSNALGDFAIGALASTTPPVIQNISVSLPVAPVGTSDTFDATVLNASAQAVFAWNFGDGATATGHPVTHAYSTEGMFTVTLTVSDGGNTVSQTAPVQTVAPNSGGQGIMNIGQSLPPVMSFDGVQITVASSNGGVITLAIDVQSLLARDAFNVSTDFDNVGGRSATVGGLSPTNKFTSSGINLALTTVTDGSGKMLGIGRKLIAIGVTELGQTAGFKNLPQKMSIAKTTTKGKFSFPKSGTSSLSRAIGAPDSVQFGGTLELPEGLDLTQSQVFAFGIGNVIDQVTISPKGKNTSAGMLTNLKTVAFSLPHPKKGQTLTLAGQTAKFTATLSHAGLSAAGFESDGITNVLKTGEKAGKPVPRTLQVALVFAGVTYQIAAPIQFTLSTKGDSGSIGGRSSQ